ncbi:peptide MFS transporter [Paenibacillus hunanensis]|uniref:POT family proton-dependent oligopeptide transporter n=1 Tax=Paenibacillus hunanensis TaxID=539262 RepID=A0ABU1J0C3_9BACL|nr:peptide MFS transporter [Paenibacillus hunanensis]MDR6243923.1 POT family proton-dependent oligopeptide transporter [Paenibacillus hunanensis]GGJ15906.1 putative transporter YclF [Paenibacillus hunanensis]
MSNPTKQEIVDSVPQRGFFGHPRGLFTLFFTEFWERFSYYGMRAILIYYMYYEVSKGGLGLDQTMATAIMSIYGSLVYMSGIIGGWLADRVFGPSRSVFYGGILIMLGHIVLAFPGGASMLFTSMALIVLGTGLLKPNVSTIVGEMYSEEDARRDSGFSIFYMGINLGGFIAPLIVGTVGTEYNFHLGFGLAAIGMLIGLIVFMLTRKKSLGLAGRIVPNPMDKDERRKVTKLLIIGAIIVAVLLAAAITFGWLTLESFVLVVAVLGVLIPVCYFVVMYRSPKTNAVERSRLTAYIPLFIAAVMFWSIQEQTSTVLALFADQRTQLQWMGITISPAWFQSLNPLFIIILAPVFAWFWMKLGDRQPTIPRKFAIGILFAGLSFLVILLPVYFSGDKELVSPLWLVLSYFIIVIGELCLSPVGLSATTKLAPAAFSAQTMSLWFLSNAAAQAINAVLTTLYSKDTELLYFGTIGGVSIVLGIILFLMGPKIQGYMKGIK